MEKIAVKCENEEQWNILQKYCNGNRPYDSGYDGYTIVCIGDYDGFIKGSFWDVSTESYLSKKGITTISFQEFEQKYLNKNTELTSLPEKWYIHPTIESNEILKKWRGGGYTGTMENSILKSTRIWEFNYPENKKGYTEITFDQFKKWVLKEEPKESKSLVGRYLKALVDEPQDIGEAKKGEYFLIEENNSKDQISIKRLLDNSSKWCANKSEFNKTWELMPEGFTSENEIPKYVKCIDSGKGYTTHPNAIEYGCVNYDYNNPLIKGKVYKVLNYLEINVNEWGFVLEFENKHYLLEKSGAIKSSREAYEAQFKQEKQYDYEVVHCTTQEEWDFVRQFVKIDITFNDAEDLYCIRDLSEKLAICFNKTEWSSLTFYKKTNSKIYSFKEWCDKFGHKPDFSNKSDNMESILEEAKRRYPIGTKIISCSMSHGEIESHDGWYYAEKHDTVYTLGGKYSIYQEGKWAEIVSLPEKEPQWIPEVGDWVVLLEYGWGNGSNTVGKAYQVQSFRVPGQFGNKYCDIYFEKFKGIPIYDRENKPVMRKALPHEIQVINQPFKVGDKLIGKSTLGNIIQNEFNPLGELGKYFVPDKVEYRENYSEVFLWAENSYWKCNIKDISHYVETNSMESPKFQVGKWYRLHNWISKFKEVKNSDEFWGEHINTESGYYDNNGWLSLSRHSHPELINDLSEIQQYLPSTHPDKNSFIKYTRIPLNQESNIIIPQSNNIVVPIKTKVVNLGKLDNEIKINVKSKTTIKIKL